MCLTKMNNLTYSRNMWIIINATYITQIKRGYIKDDKIKHISSKLFYKHKF